MSNIAIRQTGGAQATSRKWLFADLGVKYHYNVTLDLTKFAPANRKDGTIKAGTFLGKITATGLYGPYDDAATDGRQTATCILWNDVREEFVGQTTDATGAVLSALINEAKLPFPIDANGKTDLAGWFKFL